MKIAISKIKAILKRNTGLPPKSEFINQVESMLNQYRKLFEEEAHPYVLHERLSREHVEQFETIANVVLPQDYKDFILHIGDGGKFDRQFPLSISHAKDCLESSIRKNVSFEYMSLPFNLDNCNKCFDDNLDAIDDDIADKEYEQIVNEALQGTLTLHNDGCGYFIVLVVAGELAGKLFYIDTCSGQGAHEVSRSFEDYYLKWLNRKMLERLAFLEQNDKFDCMITGVKLGGNVRDLEVTKLQNHFHFQFEFFCPNDFIREGGFSEVTQINDKLVMSLYMQQESYSPVAFEKLEWAIIPDSIEQVKLIGDRSEHLVIGQVNRLFKHGSEKNNFPLYIETLNQEILIQGLNIPDLKIGDIIQVKGRLCGTVYTISR